MSRWLAMVGVGLADSTRHELSRSGPVTLPVPRFLCTCVAGPIVTGADGTERVTVTLTLAGDRTELVLEQPADEPLREPLGFQIPAYEHEPLVTILVGALTDPDGGTRLPCAA